MKDRKNVPTVDGAATLNPSTRSAAPARSMPTWSMQVPPASIAATSDSTLRPGFAEPVPTHLSTSAPSPRRAINVAGANSPAQATIPPMIKGRSQPVDTVR